MAIPCEHAEGLVPAYLDGELSEEQAAPLRAHLMECRACRERAKEGRALSRWLVAAPLPAIPPGFAARVARRAFAGDPGLLARSEGGGDEVAGERRLFGFAVGATAAAAALLLALSVTLTLRARPAPSEPLRADDLADVWREILDLEPAAAAPVEVSPVLRAGDAAEEEGSRSERVPADR